MSIREKNGKWEYRFWINGERVSKVTDWEATEPNRTKAEQKEKKHRDSILKGDEPAKRIVSRSFSRAADEFMAAMKIHHAEHPNTARRTETSLVSLREFFGSSLVDKIRPAAVECYKHCRLTVHKVKPITLRHDLDNLSKLFQWGIRMDLCTTNPVRSVEKPSNQAERIHVITLAEEFLYFERCKALKFWNLHDLAKVILLQGMCPDEVLALRKADVNLETGHVTIIKGKRDARKRTLKLTTEVREIFSRRMQQEGPWMFPSPKVPGYRMVKLNGSHDKVCYPDPTEADPNPAQLHFVLYDLRHTFATRAIENGMNPVTLANILGHKDLKMVMKYAHPTQEFMDREMERMDKSGPHPGPIQAPPEIDSAPLSVNEGNRKKGEALDRKRLQ